MQTNESKASTSKTILVYGHKGWIGSQFVDILKSMNESKKKFSYVLGKCRVDDSTSLLAELDEVRPTHVVTLIGRTHGVHDGVKYNTIDYLEQKGKLVENVRDNLFAPVSVALACERRNIHFTYLGTGCIFSYIKNQEHIGFKESALPNFFGSSYSVVKGFTDRIMHRFEKNVLNLRIRMPIVGYDNPRNFITKIKIYARICSVPNSMTVLPELLPVAIDLLLKGETGTINLTNPGVISHNEILGLYRDNVDPKFTWTNFTIEQQNKILASERSNNLLDTTRLERLCPGVRSIHDSVKALMKTYKVDHSIVRQKITNMEDCASTVVLVTGGAGFIGSNFVNYLFNTTSRLRIVNFDALYYAGKIENVDRKVRDSKRYTFVHGNLQSLDLLRYVFQQHKITHVIHFAAQSHVQDSFTDALRYTNDNVLGTHNLLEAIRTCCTTLKRMIHVSTDEVYGESQLNDKDHKTEASVLCPTNPYAATKAAAELIAQSYIHSFKMPIIITRGNNVYGPNQYPEKLIPRFIKLLKGNKQVTIQGDGSCVRGFLHAYDTATAFKTILEKGKVGEIYNIGCNSEKMEKSVMTIAKMIISRLKPGEPMEKWITYIPDRPFNDKRYYISNQKLRDLGWNPTMSLDQGLDELCSAPSAASSKESKED